MKLYNPPPSPPLVIKCYIKDKNTKHVHNISFTNVSIGNCYNELKASTKDIPESKSQSCNIQLREYKDLKFGQSVSFNYPASAVDVMYFLNKKFGEE